MRSCPETQLELENNFLVKDHYIPFHLWLFWETPHGPCPSLCLRAEDTHGPNAGTNGASTAVSDPCAALVDYFGVKWEMAIGYFLYFGEVQQYWA